MDRHIRKIKSNRKATEGKKNRMPTVRKRNNYRSEVSTMRKRVRTVETVVIKKDLKKGTYLSSYQNTTGSFLNTVSR